MPWTVIRRDFTNADSVMCVLGCGHSITSGIAYVVQAENGRTGVVGPTCVERTENYVAGIQIPDFTTLVYEVAGDGNGGGGGGGRNNAGGHPANDHQIAITYLLLRFERLEHYRILAGSNRGKLAQIYDQYRDNKNIQNSDIGYLLACANNITNHLRFNYRNLMAFYNLDNLCKIISRSKHQNIPPQDRTDFDRITRDLYRNTHVPPADIQTINRILKIIGSKHRMKENAFQY
ncbi:hypothetical protein KWH75_06395 [Morganella morganii]|uniref:hypothetical protein n=1 Tax=Morganella morganii TaxID=582 RepID=UPI0021CEE845|nr:hypothetical protein [Morganella morganii]MCU6236696.1 hypothetical protein [Morganella morganii]